MIGMLLIHVYASVPVGLLNGTFAWINGLFICASWFLLLFQPLLITSSSSFGLYGKLILYQDCIYDSPRGVQLI